MAFPILAHFYSLHFIQNSCRKEIPGLLKLLLLAVYLPGFPQRAELPSLSLLEHAVFLESSG